ncbi:MAG: hypothetical protein R3B72_09795 [Polyangiaceae bacterium]
MTAPVLPPGNSRRRRLGLAALGLVMASCHLLGGVDDEFVSVGVGWDGPFLLVSSSGEPNRCPGSSDEDTVYLGAPATEADLCACAVPASVCSVAVHLPDNNFLGVCKQIGQPAEVAPQECVQLPGGGNWVKAQRTGDLRLCTSAPLPPPAFEAKHRLCNCDGPCTSDSGEVRRCMRQGGLHACDGFGIAYPERVVVYRDARDERVCDCGLAQCDGQLEIHLPVPGQPAGERCLLNVPASVSLALDECYGPLPDGPDVVFRFDDGASTCERDGAAAARGQVVMTTPVTLCCAL